MVNGGKTEEVKGYSTDNYTRWAREFIEGKHRDKGKPWFLWLCYGGSHGPYTPAERHKDAYPDFKAEVPKDIYGPREGKPAYVRNLDIWVKVRGLEREYVFGPEDIKVLP